MKRLMLVLSMVILLVVVSCDVACSEEVKKDGKGIELIDTNDPREALTIKSTTWKTDGWGLSKWKVLVRNNSTRDWKDVLIRIIYFGESGTAIYNSERVTTRYIIIPSGKSILIIMNGVLCPEQAASAKAKIVGATLCEYTPCK